MKKSLLSFAAAMACAAMLVGCSSGDKFTTDVKSLPQSAQTVVDQHFSDLKIAQIKIDSDEYEVQFSNGTKVEFQKDGQLKDVDPVMGDSVPSALIPAPIKEYVDSIYTANA